MDQAKAQLKKVVGIQVFRSFFSCKVHAQASNLYMLYLIWFHNLEGLQYHAPIVSFMPFIVKKSFKTLSLHFHLCRSLLLDYLPLIF